MQASVPPKLCAADTFPRWAAVFLALALLAAEFGIPNKGSPEHIGFDLSRYQTETLYVPSRSTEIVTNELARSHWVYYSLISFPLPLSVAILLAGATLSRTNSLRARRCKILNVAAGIVALGTLAVLVWTLFTAKFPRISWTIAPPPILVIQAFGHYFQPSTSPHSMLTDLALSASRTSLSLLIAIVIATTLALFLGLALGHLRTLSAWISPYVYIISPLPPIVLYPVLNALTQPNSVEQFIGGSVDDPQKYLMIVRNLALTVWAVFWPIFAAVLDGARLVSPRLLAVAQLLGASAWQRLWRVVLPQSIGAILTNFRLGVIMGMIVLLFAQAKGGEPSEPKGLMTAFVPGLGGKLAQLDEEQNLAPMLACVMTVIAVVLIIDCARLIIERLCFPWLHLTSNPRLSTDSDNERRESSIDQLADHLARFAPQHVSDRIVVVEDLTARFGEFTLTVPKLAISRREIVSLIGKSSSGKTSLVEIISGMGLHDSLSGSVRLNGQELYDQAGLRRERATNLGVGFVHQDHGLFNHLTVRKNLDFAVALKRRSWSPALRQESKRLEPEIRMQLLDFLSLGSDRQIQNKYPRQLSGGQRQRVAIARALLTAEPLLVLDEGLNSIDQPTRALIRDGLGELAHKLNLTVLAISHDNQDVLQMSDRILYLERVPIPGSAGSTSTIVADTTPRDFYYTPASEEAARFVGHHNVFTIGNEPGDTADAMLRLQPAEPAASTITIPEGRIPLQRKHNLLVIPASWVNPSWNVKDATFTGVIRTEHFAGPHHELTIDCNGGFSLRAIVQDDDYVFLAQQKSRGDPSCIPRLKGNTVGLSIGHPSVPNSFV